MDISYARAADLLNNKKKELHQLANALIERETLTKEEIIAVLQNRPLPSKTTKTRTNIIPKILGTTPTLIIQ